jgi:chemotaxis protein methyltransferase CheR
VNSDQQHIIRFLSDHTGIDYHHKPQNTIEKIQSYFYNHDIPRDQLTLKSIKHNPSLLEQIINLLTVNETYFYREMKQFDILHRQTIKTDSLTILNAPCSSGEETYSILLYFLEQQRSICNLNITGIDINTHVIKQAQNAIYTSRKLDAVPSKLKHTYFHKHNDLYVLHQNFKHKCTFKALNIFEEAFSALGCFDVVFSRNMFIYFNQEKRLQAAHKLYSKIKPGGLLFLGHADILEEQFDLIQHTEHGILWYQKPLL